MADDGSWFETTDGDVLAVDKKDQRHVQFWGGFDLLIVERLFDGKVGDCRVTHVESDATLMVGWREEPVMERD